MTTKRDSIRRGTVVAVVVAMAMVGATAALAGPSAAEDATTDEIEVTPSPAEPGATATYEITHTLEVGDADEHDQIVKFPINFTAAETSNVTEDDVAVVIDDEDVPVDDVQVGETALTIHIEEQPYGGEDGDAEEHAISLTVENVTNPDEAGEYELVYEIADQDVRITQELERPTYTIEEGADETPTPTPEDDEVDDEPADGETPTPEETPTPTSEDDEDDEPADDDTDDMSGFGAAVALIALLSGLVAARRRAR